MNVEMAAKEQGEVEEVGLSSWPMSSSYPVTRAQLEARKIVKYITSQKKESEVVLHSETLQEEGPQESKKGIKERLLGLSSLFLTAQPEEEHPDVDEVDGLAEDILRPLVKLVFLKILLVDIGISFGDVLTDVLQGLSLVFDGDWNVQWSTYHYGVGVLSIMWLPGVVVLLHQATGEATYRIFPENRHWAVTLGLGLIFFLLFPLVPTVLYLRILLMKRRFRTAHEKLIFLKAEASSHEIKAIAGSLESPMELILLLWLVLRGILQLPWDRPLTSSCVGDSLGRVACLPSLPMASIFFSLLSILKALCDMNISSIVSRTNHANSIPKLGYTCHLIAQFCPFFVCNILFRTAAFSFIITFLDFWALIPGVLIFLLCLAHTVLISHGHTTEEAFPTENTKEGESETMQKDTRSSCSQEEGPVSDRITPIFLNSLLGLLLPIIYSPPTSESCNKGDLRLQVKVLAEEQAAVLRSQALLVNTCILIVVTAIFCLVTYTTTFNYWPNILTPSWLLVAFLYLILLYFISILFSWIPKIPLTDKKIERTPTHSTSRQRHLTGDSNRHSIHSASSNLVKEEQGPKDLCLKITISLVLTVFVLAPSVAGLVLFKTLGNNDLHLMQTKEGQDGLLLIHYTHLTSLNPEWTGDLVNDASFSSCENLDNIEDSALLLNMSIPACRRLHRRLAASLFPSSTPKFIVILEDLPMSRWRLSSPPELIILGSNLPVFKALALDWSQGWAPNQASVIRGQNQGSVRNSSCSRSSEIFIGEAGKDQGCSRQKHLNEDGKITETRCVKTSCSKHGLPCHTAAITKLNTECHGELFSPVFRNSRSILFSKDLNFLNEKTQNFCCFDSSNYIQYFGNSCNSLRLSTFLNQTCKFSETFRIRPCLGVGQQKLTKFCTVSNKDCVISLTTLSICEKPVSVPHFCDIDDFDCKKVQTL